MCDTSSRYCGNINASKQKATHYAQGRSSQNKRRRVTTPVNHRSERSGDNPAKVSDHSDNCPSLHLEACQRENLNNLNKNRTKRKCKQKKGTALKCKSNKIETTIVTEGDKRYGMKELEEMTCFHEKQDENKSLRIPVEVHLESATPIRCPVCSKDLKFMPPDSDFRTSFKSLSVIKSMRAHVAKHHVAEPIWNSLPKLELHRDCEAPGKRRKEYTATVPGLIAHSMASAARFIPLPETDEWLWDWKNVHRFLVCRLGSALLTCVDGTVYLRGRSSVLAAAPASVKEQRAWLKQEAYSYLKRLMNANLLPSQFWESIASPIRRRNLIQIFFYDGEAHRDCGLIERSAFPQCVHFDRVEL